MRRNGGVSLRRAMMAAALIAMFGNGIVRKSVARA